MRVILINPPAPEGCSSPFTREGRCMHRKSTWSTTWPPLSLVLTATLLRKHGATVKVIDCSAANLDREKLYTQVKAFQPQLAILNTATASIVSDLGLCQELKIRIPGLETAAFGIHVSAEAQSSLENFSGLDFVIRGEPEPTALELFQTLTRKGNLASVEGLSYKDQQNQIQHNADRPMLLDLDELPTPDWTLVDTNLYRLPVVGRPFVFLPTGRGCPYKCLFCADATYYGKKVRLRSPQKIVEDIIQVRETTKINDFMFWSETFTLNTNYVQELCQLLIDKKVNACWTCTTRPDKTDLETLSLMKKAGCWLLGLGLESGSQRILDVIKKDLSLEASREAVKIAKAAKLLTVGHFILGLPGEDQQTMQETIEFACSLGLDYAQFYCAVAFPGSELYELAKRNSWLVTRDWQRFEQNIYNFHTSTLNPLLVEAYRRRAFRKFYFRPIFLLKSLKRTPILTNLRHLINNGRLFLEYIRGS